MRHIHAPRRVSDDVGRIDVTVGDECVGHPDHRQMRVALTPTIARRHPAFIAAAQPIPHVVGEDAVADQLVALGGMALVVNGQRAPLGSHRAVIDQRHAAGRHLRANPAGEHRRALAHQIGFEPMPACLMEQDPAPAAGDHHGHLAARRGTGRELRDGALRGTLGEFSRIVVVEQLPAHRVADGLAASLQAAVATRDASHREQRPHLVIGRADAMGVGHQDPAAALAIAGSHLGDGLVRGAGGIISCAQQRHLAFGADGGRQHSNPWFSESVPPERPHVDSPPVGLPGRHRSSRTSGICQPMGAQVRCVRIARDLTGSDPDAHTAVTARVHLLNPTLVKDHAGRFPVLGEQLCPLAARVQRCTQGRIDDIEIYERLRCYLCGGRDVGCACHKAAKRLRIRCGHEMRPRHGRMWAAPSSHYCAEPRETLRNRCASPCPRERRAGRALPSAALA